MKMETEDAFNSNPNYVDLVKLVRSIQNAEGNIDCYRRGLRQCGRLDCVWREHCLMVPRGQSTSPIEPQATEGITDPKQDRGGEH